MKKILLLILLLLMSGCAPKIVLKETSTLEYGTLPDSLIAESDAEEIYYTWQDSSGNIVSPENLRINIPYQFIVRGTKGHLKSVVSKEITLVDTTAPVLHCSQDTIQLEYGQEFDGMKWIMENIQFSDTGSLTENITIHGIEQFTSTDEGKKTLIFQDEAGNSSTLTINLKLQDTTPPVIIAEKTEFTITAGSTAPPFEQYAKAFDTKDGEVQIMIENDWNSNKAGKYSLLFVAVDEADNRAEMPFTYIVKPLPQNTDNPDHANTRTDQPFKEEGKDSYKPENESPSQNTCTIRDDVLKGYNGGIHESMEACRLAGEGKAYDCGTVIDSCGNLVGYGLLLR